MYPILSVTWIKLGFQCFVLGIVISVSSSY